MGKNLGSVMNPDALPSDAQYATTNCVLCVHDGAGLGLG